MRSAGRTQQDGIQRVVDKLRVSGRAPRQR